jgi:hypothetical protein
VDEMKKNQLMSLIMESLSVKDSAARADRTTRILRAEHETVLSLLQMA